MWWPQPQPQNLNMKILDKKIKSKQISFFKT